MFYCTREVTGRRTGSHNRPKGMIWSTIYRLGVSDWLFWECDFVGRRDSCREGSHHRPHDRSGRISQSCFWNFGCLHHFGRGYISFKLCRSGPSYNIIFSAQIRRSESLLPSTMKLLLWIDRVCWEELMALIKLDFHGKAITLEVTTLWNVVLCIT